jgi:hypothetical protein
VKKSRNTLIAALAVGLLAGSAVGVVAQDEGDSGPGAVQPAEAMEPSFFTGDLVGQYSAWDESSETREDGVVVGTGSSSVRWATNDPRINGLATDIGTEVDYREGALVDSPTGVDGVIRRHRVRVVNDDGAWEGTMDLIQIDDVDLDIKAGWLVGEDAYEGLMAYIVVDYTNPGGVYGHISREGRPSAPETIPEQ